jgi:hypothetical protein
VTREAENTAGVEVIVTRNISDFTASSIPTVLPREFLAMLSAGRMSNQIQINQWKK